MVSERWNRDKRSSNYQFRDKGKEYTEFHLQAPPSLTKFESLHVLEGHNCYKATKRKEKKKSFNSSNIYYSLSVPNYQRAESTYEMQDPASGKNSL